MTERTDSRSWWRLHGATWSGIAFLFLAGGYLNINVPDALYRFKYGPVRPAVIVDGWPVSAVDADTVSSALSVNRNRLALDLCVVLAITTGAAIQIERWRRRRGADFRFASEHCVSLVVLVAVVLVFEAINGRDSIADPIDYVAAFRWPALGAMFVGLGLACFSLVELLGHLARHVGRGHGHGQTTTSGERE